MQCNTLPQWAVVANRMKYALVAALHHPESELNMSTTMNVTHMQILYLLDQMQLSYSREYWQMQACLPQLY